MRQKYFIAIFGGLVLFACQDAYAFRCGAKVISRGDSQYRVLHHCGAPGLSQNRVVYETVRRPRGQNYDGMYRRGGHGWQYGLAARREVEIPVVFEEWIYDMGPNRLIRRICFRDGYVLRVETLEHGYVEDEK